MNVYFKHPKKPALRVDLYKAGKCPYCKWGILFAARGAVCKVCRAKIVRVVLSPIEKAADKMEKRFWTMKRRSTNSSGVEYWIATGIGPFVRPKNRYQSYHNG